MTLPFRHRAVMRVASVLLCGLALTQARAQDLLIGQIASVSSVVTAANAKDLSLGMKTYFEHVNAQGGIRGRQIKVVNRDDGVNAAKMVELTREFIANKDVVALAGYINTGGLADIARQDLLGRSGMAMVAPLAGDKEIVGATNFFPFRSGYSDEVTALVKEAADTQKKRVVLTYWNVTFGPPMVKLAQELAKQKNLNVVATIELDAANAGNFEATMKRALDETAKQAPDAVIMLMSSQYATEFIKRIKSSPTASTQIYGLSIVVLDNILKTAGAERARGVVLAQAVPYPFSATLPVVGEYQRLMKQSAPDAMFSFSSFEGFAAAKILVEAITRASPNPTREKVSKALNELGEFNLGGIYVSYSPKERQGWGGVDLTIIGPNGKLMR